MTDVGPAPGEGAGADDQRDAAPPAPPALRRNPLNLALAILAIVLLVGAGVLAVLSANALSKASTRRSAAAALDAQRRVTATAEATSRGKARRLDDAQQALDAALRASVDADDVATDARSHLVDLGNQAASLQDQGNAGAARTLLADQVEPALEDFTAKAAAADKARADLQTALQQFRTDLNG